MYALEVAPIGAEKTRVYVEDSKRTVPARWVVRQVGDPGSRAGGDTSALPRLRTTSLSFYQARAVIARFAKNEYFDTIDDLGSVHNKVTQLSHAGAKRAYMAQQRIAVQKSDVDKSIGRMFRATPPNLGGRHWRDTAHLRDQESPCSVSAGDSVL